MRARPPHAWRRVADVDAAPFPSEPSPPRARPVVVTVEPRSVPVAVARRAVPAVDSCGNLLDVGRVAFDAVSG